MRICFNVLKMQRFDKNIHKKFIKYFNIKKNPSQIEMDFLAKTEKYLNYIKWLPWLRMAWIWNSISMNCATKNSDIDLLIVTTKNSMWFNRIFITLIFELLWVRKTNKKHAWMFCLSFFSTLDWLDFSLWKIENDIYLYFWIIYFKPILDYNDTYSLFLKKNSSWADFSEYNMNIENNKTYVKYIKITSSFASKSVVFFNFIFKKIFLAKTLKSYNKLKKPYWVIINNDLLKFHNRDIRKEVRLTILNK